jgi:hypothetical protein
MRNFSGAVSGLRGSTDPMSEPASRGQDVRTPTVESTTSLSDLVSMPDAVNASVIGRLLEEISWEGSAVSGYRSGGRGRENVLTAEVLQALDYLPRAQFLGSVVAAAHGADNARARLIEEIEDMGILTAGAALHAALSGVERPSFLDVRDDVWSLGDRAAWGDDSPVVIHDEFGPALEGLLAFRSPSRLASQVIHGDLTGNVLFADPAAPAIVDFVPYWRPADFALAIVVADAIAWHHAAPGLARSLPSAEDPRSILARAAIYRLITSDRAAVDLVGADPTYVKDHVDAHDRILSVLRTM